MEGENQPVQGDGIEDKRHRRRSRSGRRHHHHGHRRKRHGDHGNDQPPPDGYGAPPPDGYGAPPAWESQGQAPWWDPAMRQHVAPGPPPERPHYPPPQWYGDGGKGKGKGPPQDYGPPPGYMGQAPGPPQPLPPWRQHHPPWHGGKGGKGGKHGDGYGHHDGAPEDRYARGATVAPPAEIRHSNRSGTDPNSGKEYKLLMADGLIVCNVPPDLLSMANLHRHFRRFGEIMKLTIHDNEGRAFVQFAEQPAAEAAKNEVVLDCPDIEVNWVKRKKGAGKGRLGAAKNKGQTAADGTYVARVLITDPEERKKFEESSQKRGAVEAKKKELLQQYTKQLQVVMAKLQEQGLAEEKRESYNALLLKIKEKMSSINKMEPEAPPQAAPAPPSTKAVMEGRVRWTLDLRTKAIRIFEKDLIEQGWDVAKAQETLVEKLGKGHGIKYLTWEPAATAEKTAVVMFASRWCADQAYDRRTELGMFSMEWCDNPPPPPDPSANNTGDQMAEDKSGLPADLLRADEDQNLPAATEEAEAAPEAAGDAMEDAQELDGDAKALKEAMEKADAAEAEGSKVEDATYSVDLNEDEQ